MKYIKGIFSTVTHPDFVVREGDVASVEDNVTKKREIIELENDGFIKICSSYDEAVAFKFRGYKALAIESLQYLNPPLDNAGNSLLTGEPTMNIATGKPIKKEYNYIIDEVVEEPVVAAPVVEPVVEVKPLPIKRQR